MRIAAIHFQLPINMPTKPIMRNHSADGAFDQQFRMARAAGPNIFRFVSADVTGKTHITFLFFFLSGEPDFFRVDDNDKISGVDVWRKNCFFFAAQQVGSLHRDTTKHLALGVNDPPLVRHFAGFGGKRFHGRKKSTEITGDRRACQPMRQLESDGTYR
jgi:hypothetical protein